MNQSTKIIIDTDIAMGIPNRDVDDGLALAMANAAPELSLEAITLTFGNAELHQVITAMENFNQLLNFPTHRIAIGADSPQALSKDNDAVKLMAKLLKRTKYTLIALGPVTNIAALVTQHPELISQIERLIVVAGRRPGHRFQTGQFPLSHPDLNFEKDPSAMAEILQTDIPIIFAPYELSSKVWIDDTFLEAMRDHKTALSKYLASKCSPWLTLWKEKFSTSAHPITGFNPFDCLAISSLIHCDLITSEPVQAKIEYANYDQTAQFLQGTGETNKPYLHVTASKNSNLTYCYDINTEKYIPKLLSLFK